MLGLYFITVCYCHLGYEAIPFKMAFFPIRVILNFNSASFRPMPLHISNTFLYTLTFLQSLTYEQEIYAISEAGWLNRGTITGTTM